MPRSVKETIQSLIKLKEIDDKLTLLLRRIAEGPRVIGLRKDEVAIAETSVERKKQQIIDFKLESKSKEVELKEKEEEIKKQEVFLLTAKKMSNEEYSAHQHEIKRLKEEVGGLEEDILKAMDLAEKLKEELAGLEREMAIRRNEVEDFAREVEKDIAAYNEEIEEFKAKRRDVAEAVDFDAAQLYSRVKEARGGSGVVPVEGNTCGGCYMTVTPNDLARLRGMAEIVLCKSCQRILYLTDSVE